MSSLISIKINKKNFGVKKSLRKKNLSLNQQNIYIMVGSTTATLYSIFWLITIYSYVGTMALFRTPRYRFNTMNGWIFFDLKSICISNGKKTRIFSDRSSLTSPKFFYKTYSKTFELGPVKQQIFSVNRWVVCSNPSDEYR